MILDDIAAFLVANGVATVSGTSPSVPAPPWGCFEGYFPDDPQFDQCMVLFELQGLPALTMNREYQEVKIQFRVRGARLNYAVARAQWQLGFNTLQDSFPTSDYALVQAHSYSPLMFNDDRGRPNFITNFRVIMRT